MSATILDGRALASAMRERLSAEAARAAERRGRRAKLTLVAVGDNPSAALYGGQIVRTCLRVGLDCEVISHPASTTEAALRAEIAALGTNGTVDGVVVLLPLPRHIRQRVIMEMLPAEKDIDGLGPRNAGRLMLGFPSFVPSTADAALELLHAAGIDLQGKSAVVIGRSNVGGKPAALLFLRENATVSLCHTKTRDLAAITRQADVLFTSVGRPRSVTADMVKPGAIVLDAGLNSLDGQLLGDVDFEAVREVASALTPSPGGLGPLTHLILLRHTLIGPT